MKSSNLISKYSICGVLAGLLSISPASAQIFVADNTMVEKYTLAGADNGTTANSATLVSGLNTALGVAVSGPDLFVLKSNGVGEYNATTGATINASLIGGLSPTNFAIDDSGNLFVTNDVSGAGNATINEYTTGGAAANGSNPAILSGLTSPAGVAVYNNGNTHALFVTSSTNNSLTEYTLDTNGDGMYGVAAHGGTTTVISSALTYPFNMVIAGSDLYFVNRNPPGLPTNPGSVDDYNIGAGTLNSSFITDLNEPYGISVLGSDLYVTESMAGGTVAEYTTSGQSVNISSQYPTVTGVGYPAGIDVVSSLSAAPEPYSQAMGMIVVALFVVLRLRRRVA